MNFSQECFLLPSSGSIWTINLNIYYLNKTDQVAIVMTIPFSGFFSKNWDNILVFYLIRIMFNQWPKISLHWFYLELFFYIAFFLLLLFNYVTLIFFIFFRCSEEMARTKLNSHMDQKHGLKNFKQLLKRSFHPNESGKLGPKEKIQKTADLDFSNPISLRNANAGFVK